VRLFWLFYHGGLKASADDKILTEYESIVGTKKYDEIVVKMQM
jgi:hypothetical protein